MSICMIEHCDNDTLTGSDLCGICARTKHFTHRACFHCAAPPEPTLRLVTTEYVGEIRAVYSGDVPVMVDLLDELGVAA